MQTITHEEQQERWEKEHRQPQVLLQMDASHPSSGVVKFLDWLKTQKPVDTLSGIEMCCGKGRNVIWLAQQGVTMSMGIDFSPAAITEAKKRAKAAGFSDNTQFFVHDATRPYPVKAASLDFAYDCFGSTDIESSDKRRQALDNLLATLKPGGYLMVYLLSTDDEFHHEMIRKHPGPDAGSFIHPVNGKYEKAFTEKEVKEIYKDLKLITLERVPKKATFFDKEYNCNHIWAILQKPS